MMPLFIKEVLSNMPENQHQIHSPPTDQERHMEDVRVKERAEYESLLFHARGISLVLGGWVMGIIASTALVVLSGPGFQLFASILYIVVGFIWTVGWSIELYSTTMDIDPKKKSGQSASLVANTPATTSAVTATATAEAATPIQSSNPETNA
jgi:hypothetical protein